MLKQLFLLISINIFAFASINLAEQKITISEIKNDEIKINLGALTIGQTGVIVRNLSNGHSIILAQAEVKESLKDTSTLTIQKFLGLEQDALPTFKSKVEKGDKFVLNYLYSSALLIAPNQESFIKARRLFNSFKFLHSDVFASYMKIDSEEYPSLEEFQEFALKQNIGTLFFVVDEFIYVYDAKSLKVLLKKELKYNDKKTAMPFYTRVEEIDTYEEDYTQYYKEFLGIKND